ncbi:hypothetical protein BDV97DRAFT_350325 [Delphinella strobiligena]|nr:hypothetical protein BDV97DRAFT_350325 [Delphinella strobiligena]
MAASATSSLDKQLQTLSAGFDALQNEYQRLWNRCQTLESNLETAKTQYVRLTSQCPHKAEPLIFPDPSVDASLPSLGKPMVLSAVSDDTQRNKISAACRLSQQIRTTGRTMPNGVAIHSGPSADRGSAPNSSAMPSISESPLEQDFTVAGTPSKLDCPFASMANRRLSAHAASVVSRYRPEAPTPRSSLSRRSSVSHINGRASSVAKASLTDPIKAETCGMERTTSNGQDVEASVQGSTGVCPIRFLDQHSPEEVAAYFESHKHELPRSHEVCVKRYQSNEESIRALDAKYGNLVSMITGLGQKHASLLPDKIGDDEDEDNDRASAEKIRKWANSVDTTAADVDPSQPEDAPSDQDRQPRFDRPLKDVRLGESPSRPWGIQVPIHVNRREGYATSAEVARPAPEPISAGRVPQADSRTEKPRARCPFGFDAAAEQRVDQTPLPPPTPLPSIPEPDSPPKATFINPGPADKTSDSVQAAPQMVFTGPVFIGYSLEQAMSLLQSAQQHNNTNAPR